VSALEGQTTAAAGEDAAALQTLQEQLEELRQEVDVEKQASLLLFYCRYRS